MWLFKFGVPVLGILGFGHAVYEVFTDKVDFEKMGLTKPTLKMFGVVSHNLVKDFEAFLRVLGSEAGPLIETMNNYRLIGLTIGTTAVAGLLSEVLHWFLVRMRRLREDDEGPKEEVKAGVAKAGGPLS